MNPDSKLKGMIDLRWNWVIELQDTEQIRAVKVHTAHNVADILTKCLNRHTYEHIQTIPGPAVLLMKVRHLHETSIYGQPL